MQNPINFSNSVSHWRASSHGAGGHSNPLYRFLIHLRARCFTNHWHHETRSRTAYLPRYLLACKVDVLRIVQYYVEAIEFSHCRTTPGKGRRELWATHRTGCSLFSCGMDPGMISWWGNNTGQQITKSAKYNNQRESTERNAKRCAWKLSAD